MNYQLWADDAKTKLSKLPNNELWKLAYSPDPDTVKIANDILLERTNQNRFVKKFDVDSVEFLPREYEARG